MLLGYNTNGFSDHRLADALTILAELGYEAAAITIERDHLDPPDRRGVAACLGRIAPAIESAGLKPTIETGSRYILDPWRKHQPTLLSADAADARRRVEFLKAAVETAAAVGADVVSLWSGAADDRAGEGVLWDRLTRSLVCVLDHAAAHGVRLAFEPEPGMFVDTMDRFVELMERIGHPALGLTLDVGHLMCLDDGRIDQHLTRWRDRLWNVHLEDMRDGVHEHLLFGDGDIDVAGVVGALNRYGYTGGLHVELPRHSHVAVDAARSSFRFLSEALGRHVA